MLKKNGTVIGMLFLVHWIEREILSKNINVGQTSAIVVMDGLYWNVWNMAITYVDIWLLCDKISSERIEMYNNIGVIWQPGKLGQQQPVQVYLYIETNWSQIFLVIKVFLPRVHQDVVQIRKGRDSKPDQGWPEEGDAVRRQGMEPLALVHRALNRSF